MSMAGMVKASTCLWRMNLDGGGGRGGGTIIIVIIIIIIIIRMLGVLLGL